MGMYAVTLRQTARQAFRHFPKARQERIIAIVKQIAADPFVRHPQIRRLKRERSTFRYRLGDWRILYRIDRKTRTLEVLDIRPRGGAYR